MANVMSFGQTISWMLMATTHKNRALARLIIGMWLEKCPKELEHGVNFEPVEWFDGDIEVHDLQETPAPEIAKEVVTPTQMIQQIAELFGDVAVIGIEGDWTFISPELASQLGDLGGGEVQLYAQTLVGLYSLITTPAAERTDDWVRWVKQWLRGHRGALQSIVQGPPRSSDNAGFVKKAFRGKGVYSAKVGAWMARYQSQPIVENGEVVQLGHTYICQPDNMYVSSKSPLAKLQGKHIVRWRNPMPFLKMAKVVVIGDITEGCPRPDVYTPGRFPIPATKVFFHPFDISTTAGDVDGDGLQFFCMEELIDWCLRRPKTIAHYPGLWESILHHFCD